MLIVEDSRKQGGEKSGFSDLFVEEKSRETLAASLLASVQKMAAFNYSVDLDEERRRNVRFNYGFGSDVFPRAYFLGSLRN
jgi:hypothetical protein